MMDILCSCGGIQTAYLESMAGLDESQIFCSGCVEPNHSHVMVILRTKAFAVITGLD